MKLAEHFFQYAIIFLFTFGLSIVLTKLFIHISHKLKLLDYPGEIKKHSNPTPFMGGVGIFASFWIVSGIIVYLSSYIQGTEEFFLEGMLYSRINVNSTAILIFLGAAVTLGIGVYDDKKALKPATKLLLLSFVPLLLISNADLTTDFTGAVGWIGKILTFFWILTLINAFNFIDSIDGHCAGIGLIACLIFFVISQIIFQPVVGVAVVILAGAIAGFIPFNFRNAKIFLGDNGSMFLGYMLAIIALLMSYRWNQPGSLASLFPVLVFGVPIYDLISVVTVRISKGIPPWRGDRNHFAHRLLQMGMSKTDAILFSYLVAIATGLMAILSTQIPSLTGSAFLLLTYIILLMIVSILEAYAVYGKVSLIEKYWKATRSIMGSSGKTADRRDSHRLATLELIKVEHPYDKLELVSNVCDYSEKGLCFYSDTEYPASKRCKAKIMIVKSNSVQEVELEIRWCKKSKNKEMYQVGARITSKIDDFRALMEGDGKKEGK